MKSLENCVTDGWDSTFDVLWSKIEEYLDRGLPLNEDMLLSLITESSRKQLSNLDKDQFNSAFNGLYLGAREHAYKLTGGKG